MNKIDHARALAAQGFRVFPLIPNDKRPAIERWPDKATTDLATIDRYWRSHPDANIGIATGAGLMVVDVDMKNGKNGYATLIALERRHGTIQSSMTISTPSGGMHLYLRTKASVPNSVDKVGPGIDIRGEGGYVVGPGSTIDGREYVRCERHFPKTTRDSLMEKLS